MRGLFYWLCKYVLVGPLLWLLYRPKVVGRENIPPTGPAIFASNHLSFSDSIFLPLVISQQITFLAKAEYFTTPGIKGMLTRWFFKGTGQVAIDRRSGSAAANALSTGVRVLSEGRILGIYPEGTRSPDGRLYRGKTGVARLALAARVPVIPVAMVNTDKIQPIGARIPRIMQVEIRIGKPLDFSRYEGLAGDRIVERSITDEIMYELQKLSGQEYVDVYAAAVKQGSITPRQARPAALTKAA